jgi:hypothetical protein
MGAVPHHAREDAATCELASAGRGARVRLCQSLRNYEPDESHLPAAVGKGEVDISILSRGTRPSRANLNRMLLDRYELFCDGAPAWRRRAPTCPTCFAPQGRADGTGPAAFGPEVRTAPEGAFRVPVFLPPAAGDADPMMVALNQRCVTTVVSVAIMSVMRFRHRGIFHGRRCLKGRCGSDAAADHDAGGEHRRGDGRIDDLHR